MDQNHNLTLIFSKDSVLSTTLSLTSGEAIYELSMPEPNIDKIRKTTIKKHNVDIGTVELRKSCILNGRALAPKRTGLRMRPTTFVLSDGKEYTWHCGHSKSQLKSTHTSGSDVDATIATFVCSDPFDTQRLNAKLTINATESHLGDEIVATFVYVEQGKRFSRTGKAFETVILGICNPGMGSSGVPVAAPAN